jgi:hypothetical protein
LLEHGDREDVVDPECHPEDEDGTRESWQAAKERSQRDSDSGHEERAGQEQGGPDSPAYLGHDERSGEAPDR